MQPISGGRLMDKMDKEVKARRIVEVSLEQIMRQRSAERIAGQSGRILICR